MRQIAISASLKYKETIRQVISNLHQVGVVGLFPNLDSGVAKENVNLEFMKKLESDHFKAIDDSEGIYVICPEGKVGTLVSVEIGYACAKGKVAIFSQIPEDLGLQTLVSSCISLEEISQIKNL